MRAAVVVGILAGSAAPAAADGARAVAVHTDVSEARACLPLAGGGALIGTGGGLVRADATGGITATWTATDGLPGTRIDTIAELGDGELWVGTDAGAARITVSENDRTGKNAKTALTIDRAIRERHSVRAIARLGDTTYLATWDGGLEQLPGAATKPTQVKFRTGKGTGARARVAALAVVGDTLYAGTAAGLYQLARGRLAPVTVDGITDTAVVALYADGDGTTLWIATADGLHARAADGTVTHYPAGDLRAIASVDGAIVIAGVADGLARADRGRLRPLAGIPRELAVAQTIGTRGDALCAGGLAGAWLRASADAAWTQVATPDGPPANDLTALAADDDRLWVGTFDHGLAVHDSTGWTTVTSDNLDHRVNALALEPRAGHRPRVWVATANGLSAVDGDDLTRVTRIGRRDGLPGRGVLALAVLADGRIVAGTSYGAVIVTDGRPARLGPKDQELGTVWAVAQDRDGLLWLGTTTGLYRGRDTDDTWQRFSLATGELADDWVTALAVHGDRVVAGTYHGGITDFTLATDGGAVTATHLGDGWVNPSGLSFDGDRLLAATMDGLAIRTDATWTIATGLPGRDTTAAARIGATLYVATRRGLAELR